MILLQTLNSACSSAIISRFGGDDFQHDIAGMAEEADSSIAVAVENCPFEGVQ